MAGEPRQIAVVRSYDELMAALRKRAADLNVSRNVFDEISGLQVGYAAKLLAPVPIKALGRTSMGLLLSAMGLMLIVVEDIEMMAKITRRHAPRKSQFVRHASETMLPKRKRSKRGFRGTEVSQILNARRTLTLPEAKRKSIAKRAARARWRNARRLRKQQDAGVQNEANA